MKSLRRKNKKIESNTYIINTIVKPQKCFNCGKKKPLHYYEIKNKLCSKSEIQIRMCKECLEELKFKILESPSKEKQAYHDNMVNIINSMLKENDCVSKES